MAREDRIPSDSTEAGTKKASEPEDTWRAGAEVPAHWQEVADKKLDHGERKEIIRNALRRELFGEAEAKKQQLLKQREEKVEERAQKKKRRNDLNDELEGLAGQISDIDNRIHQLEQQESELEERIEEFVVEEVEPSSIELVPENLAVQRMADELGIMTEELVEKARRKAAELEVEV